MCWNEKVLLKILSEVFGYSRFKPLQLSIIQAILMNQNVFVQLMPGAGKSICYQLPALLGEGVTVVISPLMALMHDQVLALRALNIAASYLDSSLNSIEQNTLYQALKSNQIRLLYVSPERFKNQFFLSLIKEIKIDRFVVDEAHCISQWGHDFRKDYLNLRILADYLPSIPRVALTATADTETKKDIIQALSLSPIQLFECYEHPEHLRVNFLPKNNVKQQLLQFLKNRPESECGLVYCFSRNQAEKIAHFLEQEGYKTYLYHAGLATHIRLLNQKLFKTAKSGIMVATIAFGLGIDKPNIRFVAHLNLPTSIERYIQEAGRAGRDGLPAVSWVCYGLNDFILQNECIKNDELADQQKKLKLKKLRQMLMLCDTPLNKKTLLQQYFTFERDLETFCSKEPVKRSTDISPYAVSILTVVFYTDQNANITETIQILQGKAGQLKEQFKLFNTMIFGSYPQTSTTFWRSIIRCMLGLNLLEVSNRAQLLRLTPCSITFMKKKPTLWIRKEVLSHSVAVNYLPSSPIKANS
ncbi:MAG: ATP-dependent DNA helicase RecQ [Neisseriaceae bacterium]